jgi:hypothetical protein
MRRTWLGSLLLKAVVLVVGGVFIALGAALIVLPGPLTIPPVLLGLYIWSTEFSWAERLRLRTAAHGRVAWAATKRRPVHAAAVTSAGLAALVAALMAGSRYSLVDRVTGVFG